MYIRIYQAILVTLISISFSASAYCSDWELTLRVSGGETYGYCIAGVKDGATDGRDTAWDIPAPPDNLGDIYIYAYFPHPEWGYVFDTFSQDIKAPDLLKEWAFEVVSNVAGELTIQWPGLKEIIPDKKAVLVAVDIKDANGLELEIDMHASSSFVFENDVLESAKRFLVKVSPGVPAPEPPEGLKGVVIQRNVVFVHWQKNHELDLAGYNVYRSVVTGSGYQKINSPLIEEHRDRDGQAAEGLTYYYVVTAVNTSGGESGYSNEVKVTP